MPGTHSSIGPSGAKRWAFCTASPKAIADLGLESVDSADSILGTTAHTYGEKVLRGEMTVAELPDEFKHVAIYTDYCQTLKKRWGGDEEIEEEVDLFYRRGDHGTVDWRLLSNAGLWITDYKNGITPVPSFENPQMALYAQSVMEDPANYLMFDFHDDFRVEMAIVQPNCPGDEPVKVWETTAKELREFVQFYRDQAAIINAADEGDEEAIAQLVFAPSYEACRWCPMKNVCVARANSITEPLSVEVEVMEYMELEGPDETKPLPLTVVEKLTDRQILGFFQNAKLIEGYLKGIRKLVMQRQAEGNPVPGTKVVLGRKGNRKWADEGAVASAVVEQGVGLDEIGEWKLKSPAKIEAAFKAGQKNFKALESLIVRPDGKPTVVLDTDPRPAYLDFNELFDDEDEGE